MVGPLVQEQHDHVGLAPLGSNVEGGDVVLERERRFLFIATVIKILELPFHLFVQIRSSCEA